MAASGGQPGNNNAGKNKPFWRCLERAIAQDDGKKLRAAAEKLIEMAAAGDIQALRELADRTDGKPAQAITGAGDDGAHVLKIIHEAA